VAATHDTATYYDRLSRWTAVARLFGYGGGRNRLTVHRALADPRHDGRPTVTRLHDLLLEALPQLTSGRILDAGCGLGGTMLDLARRGSGTFTGVTLSERQAEIARRAAAHGGLAARVSILAGSYDSPPPGPYDAVIAIESLAHSTSPAASVRAMAAQLAPGGVLAIVDDMPEPGAHGSPDLEAFKTGWQTPVLWSCDELIASLHDIGLGPIEQRDLTAALRPRSLERIARLEGLNRVARGLAPTAGLRAMLDSYRGGLALERLYRRALMSYRLVVARRS
jgi:tocopherol O-methyltransferase